MAKSKHVAVLDSIRKEMVETDTLLRVVTPYGLTHGQNVVLHDMLDIAVETADFAQIANELIEANLAD